MAPCFAGDARHHRAAIGSTSTRGVIIVSSFGLSFDLSFNRA
jgi:hypothetical protein